MGEAHFENNTIRLSVRNEHLLKLLQEHQTTVLLAIKRIFNNGTIQLEFSVAEVENDAPQKLHLSKDKLQHYITKNKQFDELRQALNLEI